MKAMRWHGQRDLRIEDVPEPTPKTGEVKLKVLYSGICGSEIHEYIAGPIFIPLEPHPLTGTKAPQIMGHEFGGKVVELGKGVTDLKIGDKVTVNPILSCGKCYSCLKGHFNHCSSLAYYGLIGNGGHAEYAVVKAGNCYKIPENAPSEIVAFGEPAGVALHAVKRGGVKKGDRVVVLGAGPIGLMVAQYAKVAGAEKIYITEIAPRRIKCAETLGAADKVLNPLDTDVVKEVLGETDGLGADVVIECVGGKKSGKLEDTGVLAVELTKSEGTTVIVGTFAEPSDFHFNNVVLMERNILGSWVWRGEFPEAVDLMTGGKVKIQPLITRKVKLDEAVQKGIQELELNRDENVKILIEL